MTARAKLLFVDDEERVVKLMRLMFRNDYDIYTALSGSQALEILAAQRIDVVVSDQRMPEMSGIELLTEVRHRWPSTMRILLTGYADLAAIVGSVNDGEVFRFIHKPWDHEAVKVILAQAVEAAQISHHATAPAKIDGAEALPLPASEGATRNPGGSVGEGMAPGGASHPTPPGLLLLDDSATDREAITQLFRTNYRVLCAANIHEALAMLAQHDIGVIVAEARVGGDDTGQLLRVLKQHYPTITTVILTRVADAEHVIKLINQVQIFRFAVKPIRATVFQMTVSAAMKAHLVLRSNPVLAVRHSVAASTDPVDESLVGQVLKTLRVLRSRWWGLAS